jgi:formylglycine-generating enzyme required for sulfatase activity
VKDLSGNAAEWTQACDEDTADGTCRARGGSFRSDWDALACGAAHSYGRLKHDASIGFRCCSRP